MLLMDQQTKTLIKVMQIDDLVNPVRDQISGRRQAGEEEQPPRSFDKTQLAFPSGESLPQCWTDKNYREEVPSTPASSN